MKRVSGFNSLIFARTIYSLLLSSFFSDSSASVPKEPEPYPIELLKAPRHSYDFIGVVVPDIIESVRTMVD